MILEPPRTKKMSDEFIVFKAGYDWYQGVGQNVNDPIAFMCIKE